MEYSTSGVKSPKFTPHYGSITVDTPPSTFRDVWNPVGVSAYRIKTILVDRFSGDRNEYLGPNSPYQTGNSSQLPSPEVHTLIAAEKSV